MHVVPVVALPPIFGADVDNSVSAPDLGLPHEVTGTVQVQLVQESMPFIDRAPQQAASKYVHSWDDFVGQAALKEYLGVRIADAEGRMERLGHTLLASGMPGVGKTTIARLIASSMHATEFKILAPPFSREALFEAAMEMPDWGILLIDEIHKMADNGPAMIENLLHILEDGALYLPSGTVQLREFTVIGTTTEADKLPEPILDRFPIQPPFEPYTLADLVNITKNFLSPKNMNVRLTPETIVAIAKACRRTPRIARMFCEDAQALLNVRGRCTPDELLRFTRVEANGLTVVHKRYILGMYQLFRNERDDGRVEYIAGMESMMSILRENKVGVTRLERFLMDEGLLTRTPRGRRLTPAAIALAEAWIARGEKWKP